MSYNIEVSNTQMVDILLTISNAISWMEMILF